MILSRPAIHCCVFFFFRTNIAFSLRVTFALFWKMDRVEAALARMRAREAAKTEEDDGPKKIEGYEWDADKCRYFPSTPKKKTLGSTLPDCIDLESRVIRSRARLERVQDIGLLPTCAAMNIETGEIAVGGGLRVRVLGSARELATKSSVTSIAFTDEGLAYGEIEGCLRLPRLSIPVSVWSFACRNSTSIVGSHRSLKIYDAERLVLAFKMASDCLAVAVHQPSVYFAGARNGELSLKDSRRRRHDVVLRRFTSAVDDVVKVDEFAFLACDRNESLELLDTRKAGPVLCFAGRKASPGLSGKVVLFDDGYCCSGTRGHSLRCWRIRDARPVADVALPSKSSALIAVKSNGNKSSSLFRDDNAYFVTRELNRHCNATDDLAWDSSLVNFSVKPQPMRLLA